MAQVVEYLLCKFEAQSLNLIPPKKGRREGEREGERERERERERRKNERKKERERKDSCYYYHYSFSCLQGESQVETAN
jgi:hypothetical protein